MQPDSESTVRVWLEAADFASMLRWIAMLNGSYGVGVSAAAISRDARAGYVRARLDFVRAP
jgi:type II secretory pathway component PulM